MTSCPPPNPATYCQLNAIETCIDPIDTAAIYPMGSGGDNPNGPMDDWNNNCPPKPTVCYEPCTYSPLARLVITVTSLRNAVGVTAEEILEQHNTVICPDKSLDLDQVNRLLAQGTKQGIFFRNSEDSVYTYKVFGAFGVLPSNIQFVKELGPGFQICLGMYCNTVL